ncbi:DUF5348 domain-containing protein [Lachnotalea sp. AF33-28]
MWIPARVEMAGEWYLVGLPGLISWFMDSFIS